MPAVQTSPYDSAEFVLQLARTMANDAALSIAGSILADTQPYVFVMLEGAYRYLRKLLTSEGVNTFSKYLIVKGLTPVAAPGGIIDPTIQVQLSYTGYFDGVTNFSPTSFPPGPTLPGDMLEPLEIWERQNGTVNRWREMKQAADSLNSSYQGATFSVWDWETDILYLPGATITNDLRIKYLYKMATLTGPDSVVQIKDCAEALALLFVSAAAKSRGGTVVGADYDAQGRASVKLMVNQTARRENYAKFVRAPFRGRRGRR